MKPQYIRIDEDGNKFTYKDKEMKVLHSETGPAMEFVDGSKYWLENGELHRNYGPASVHENGNTFWYKHGVAHRENGPALEFVDGSKSWFLNGKRHRTDGPAIICATGIKLWYLNDKQVTQEEHARLTKKVTTVNINGKEFTLEELNSLIETVKR